MVSAGFVTFILITFVTITYFLRHYAFPLLFRTFSHVRVASFSLFSVRGLEWRNEENVNSVVPTLRIERVRWVWGGLKGEATGLWMLRIEGLSFRVKKGAAKEPVADHPRRIPGRFSAFLNWCSSTALHLCIHHWSSLASIVSIQLCDTRIIFDDFEGVELNWKEFRLGVNINFEGSIEEQFSSFATKPPSPNPMSPYTERSNPLLSPECEFSPPPSPVQFTSFSFTPGQQGKTTIQEPECPIPSRQSRMSHMRRRASRFGGGVSSAAVQIWSRAVARAHGSVSISVVSSEIALIRPNFHHPHANSLSAQQSMPSMHSRYLSTKASNNSLHSDSGIRMPRSNSFVSMRSLNTLNTLLHPPTPRYALPSSNGYEKLIVIEGRSKANLALGFGPKKGLLGEDTLKVEFDMGKLQTCFEAVEKIQEMLDSRKKTKSEENEGPVRPVLNNWSPTAAPRIVMRALESVTVAFSHINVLHHLPASLSYPSSTRSSATDLSDLLASTPTEAECFTVSLDVSRIACTLSAADSSNNERARNAFGTNPSPESKIRGVGFKVQWQTIELHCLAPGERNDEKSQLLEIRQADFEGLSTWRPNGWTRDEMLFSSDPNLALIVMRGGINSVDMAGDVQLFDELCHAWDCSRPRREQKQPKVSTPSTSLPPRLRMVLEVGHVMAIVADRVSEQKTTLSLASDGFNVGCFTGFSDVVGRRRDKASSKAAFKEEEKLRTRRETIPEDYTQPESMWKPDVRRHYGTPARIADDFSISLKADASISIEPITLHMSLSGANARDQKAYHLASIGRIHGTLSGEVLGRQDYVPKETSSLDPTSLVASVNVGIDNGIKCSLYDMPVIDALCTMGQAHSSPSKTPSTANAEALLERLPAGVSVRLSLGHIETIIGHPDPNPNCKLGLYKGLKIDSVVSLEYSYFKHKSQAAQSRHPLISSERRKLQLRDDITTQALAFHNYLHKDGGRAALMSMTAMETTVTPLFNVKRLIERGVQTLKTVKTPTEKEEDPFVGWEFRSQHHTASQTGEFANSVPPLEISDTDQARRPLLQLPHSTVNWLIQKARDVSPIEHKVTSKIAQVQLVGDLSHVYCVLLASLTITAVSKAWRKPKLANLPSSPSANPNLSTEISIPSVTVHLALPLEEQVFIYLKAVTLDKLPLTGMAAGLEQMIVYVPSPRAIGSWEDLARLKRLVVKGQGNAFDIDVEALSIRIPTAYQMSKLVLNLNVSMKAIKLLMSDLDGKRFATTQFPTPEAPKRIPKLDIKIRHVILEAADNPIETVLTLISRAGMVEQEIRNGLEETFNRKKALIAEDTDESGDDMHPPTSKLTKNATVEEAEARERLYWWMARSWIRRIRAAKAEQKRREEAAMKHTQNVGPDIHLPIKIVKPGVSAPLFRATFEGFQFTVEDAGLSREEIINYMAEASSPFVPDVEFSLMIPTKFSWKMNSAVVTLRDYPLPLVRIQPVEKGDLPGWQVDTVFIIAEEMADEDSFVLVPCPVIPCGCGALEAEPFEVQIAKTIMPVKTYARPHIKIRSEKTTEFTWGNSYQPAIQDFMKVIESLSHPPRDPSPRVGFWDKFRLILHWKVIAEFTGPAHLHLKGSSDPYMVNGVGAGFALSWRGNARLEIAQPNNQGETIQMSAEELLIAIPDLTALHDGAAIGNNPKGPAAEKHSSAQQNLIERRYTKPCARFLNGVRVGFGFKLERTCRPWNCRKCGPTDNLMHRQCRSFDFISHQDVILRTPEFVDRESERLGRPYDSYEGFRSDYIHFSISLEAPDQPKNETDEDDPDKINSLHFSPKAFAHFYAWWKLFDHTTSLPIRQGSLFPDSPPPSKKFGRSLATIKYRFDLAPVYVSHIYHQVSQDLWAIGKGQALGLKARFGRFRADAHQRAQEKTVRHEKLHRTKTITHKTFYAADLLLANIKVKGLCAEFAEATFRPDSVPEDKNTSPKASDLPKHLQVWYNFFDYIDADRKPFDRNPKIEIVDIGDCPSIVFSKRVKAKKTRPDDKDDSSLGSFDGENGPEIESSKFGHEKSHICYLGAAPSVGAEQMSITKGRIRELQMEMAANGLGGKDQEVLKGRMKTLRKHLEDLSMTEKRQIDDDTFQSDHMKDHSQVNNQDGDVTFQDTFHIHCPRIFFNNASRNIVFKYWYSYEDRKSEAYTTSHISLRGIRDGIHKRNERVANGARSFLTASGASSTSELAHDMLKDLASCLQDAAAGSKFALPADVQLESDLRIPKIGLPEECSVRPKTRILVLKPQIALRSEVDENAIVLLAVEEISFKGFAIVDDSAYDDVTADVLNRHYITLKGLQAFYPCEDSMQRSRTALGIPQGLDFVPLEIFLDVRSEATDYDRIVLKTDVAISLDKFNHLRLPRGLNWPETVDEWGRSVDHLRLHQNLTTVVVPRITLSATSKHFTALYNVVTDLLMYQDPAHRHRSERIDNFIYAFDRKDRDPDRLLAELFTLQQTIRQLALLMRGYEANVDLLTEEGKAELFKIRTDLMQGLEQLLTVFEAVSINQSRDDAKAALKSSSRMEVRAGSIAWQMLNENFKPLIKLDIQRTAFSSISNNDGSTDGALVINDLSALNSNADAVFPEVMVRYESQTFRKKSRDPFASVCWSILAPVGGIPIIRDLSVYLHPVRFKIERVVGDQIKSYIFNEGTTRKKVKDEVTNGHLDPPTLNRTRSNSSIFPQNGVGNGSPSGNGNETPTGRHNAKFTMVPSEDAAEMKRRASSSKTYIRISFASTGLVFSYKRDPSQHKVITLPDCVDLKFRLPELIYENKVWSPRDLFDQVQKDVRNYAWSQGGDLFTQVLKKTSLFRTKKAFKHLSSVGTDVVPRSSSVPPSKLKYTVEPPTPASEDGQNLSRILSNHAIAATAAAAASHNGTAYPELASPIQIRNGSQDYSNGSSILSDSSHTSLVKPSEATFSNPSLVSEKSRSSYPEGADDEDEESIAEHDGHVSGKHRVKGLFGKLRHPRLTASSTRDLNSREASREDLSRIISSDRPRGRASTLAS